MMTQMEITLRATVSRAPILSYCCTHTEPIKYIDELNISHSNIGLSRSILFFVLRET